MLCEPTFQHFFF